MSLKETLKRYAVFLVGLSIMALAVSLISKAALGISPVQSLAYVIYHRLSDYVTFGTMVFCWNCIQILLQVILLRRFGFEEIIQIPLSFFLSLLVDVTGWLVAPIAIKGPVGQCIVMLIGIVVLAIAISITVAANVVMNSGEALVNVIAKKTNKTFAFVKEIFDLTLVTLSVVLCFVFFQRWRFDIIGIGTVCCAVLTGFAVRLVDKAVKPIVRKIVGEEEK